jgi:hypothetical protein
MTKSIEDIEAAMVSAFPAVIIERATIDEPTALWSVYDDASDLAAFEGKTWRDLPAELLVRHSTLPIYAGDGLFRIILPAYLQYLLHEQRQFNDLPFQLASQLTRKDDPESHPKFDRRIAGLTSEQRAAVRAALAVLSTRRPMEEAMTRALATWDDLAAEGGSR